MLYKCRSHRCIRVVPAKLGLVYIYSVHIKPLIAFQLSVLIQYVCDRTSWVTLSDNINPSHVRLGKLMCWEAAIPMTPTGEPSHKHHIWSIQWNLSAFCLLQNVWILNTFHSFFCKICETSMPLTHYSHWWSKWQTCEATSRLQPPNSKRILVEVTWVQLYSIGPAQDKR